jgi:hypothetical protein
LGVVDKRSKLDVVTFHLMFYRLQVDRFRNLSGVVCHQLALTLLKMNILESFKFGRMRDIPDIRLAAQFRQQLFGPPFFTL